MFSNVTMPYFRKRYDAARQDSELIREATSPLVPGVRGTRYFHWSDGSDQAGFAVRSTGELVYVYSTRRGLGDLIIALAIEEGATHLDCFDGHLTRLYSRHGFARVTSLPNWDEGEPDVVYMATAGNALLALDRAEQDAGTNDS